MFVSELEVSIREAAFLSTGRPQSILKQIEQQVCCKFSLKQKSWDDHKIVIAGTSVGVEKGRAQIKKELKRKFQYERRNEAKSNQTFEMFSKLPFEMKQMIVDRVQCDDPATSKDDGLALMNLRSVGKEFQFLSEQTLKNKRKCFKERLFIAETFKSGQVRLGTPPLLSKIHVTFDELNQLVSKMSLVKTCEIHIRCEFRKEWCDSVLKVLLKNPHIEPKLLKIYGLPGKTALIHQYVQQASSLKHLVFEKTPNSSKLIKQAFLPVISTHFFDLGPQDNMPENVRNSFNSRIIFTRYPCKGEEYQQLMSQSELKF